MILEIGSGRHGDPLRSQTFLAISRSPRGSPTRTATSTVLVQVDERVGHAQLDVDFRIKAQELPELGNEIDRAECVGAGDPHQSGRRRLAGARFLQTAIGIDNLAGFLIEARTSSVSETRAPRLRSFTPNSRSSALIALLTAGCPRPRALAAFEKPPVSTIVVSVCRLFSRSISRLLKFQIGIWRMPICSVQVKLDMG